LKNSVFSFLIAKTPFHLGTTISLLLIKISLSRTLHRQLPCSHHH